MPYLEALKKEASSYRDCSVSTVYIGGGTPTYLTVEQIRYLFSIIRSNFILEEGAEFTIEANPATFDLDKATLLHELGANRASLGVQSLSDKNLKWLGRPHTAQDACLAFDILRNAGFNNINCDLIHSLPGQSKEEIRDDLERLVSLGSEHISLYSLSITEGSALYERNIRPICEREEAGYYLFVAGLLIKKGFLHYEVSNFARQGFSCRHNLNYWQGGDYIGLGVGAHSHLDNCRSWNEPGLESYLAMIKEKGSAKSGQERLLADARLCETFLIGLRMAGGVDLKELESRFGIEFPPDKREVLEGLIQHGLLAKEKDLIKATPSGMVVLDEICSRLI